METNGRHQCLIYRGAPSTHLPALAEVIRSKLQANIRCLYLNSPAMVAGIRSYLSALDVDVAAEMARARLVLTSERDHLLDGKFDPKRMVSLLNQGLAEALAEGYAGLWASGDMAWEFGVESDFSKLIEYERTLDSFLQKNPQTSGICQYHADHLPPGALCQGLALHPALFVNTSLARRNPYYVMVSTRATEWPVYSVLEKAVEQLCIETSGVPTTES